MHEHNSVGRWVGVALALLVAAGIGALAYQAGVQHGVALQLPAGGAATAAPPPFAYYPYYGWYHPWGFGFAGPFLFILLWVGLARAMFWRRRRCYSMHDGPWGLDDWHRRAHDRMRNEPPAPTNA